MNKRLLIEQIVVALVADLEGYSRSARAAHAEATDEQSRAENKYDTRGLEASYLARGQSRQASEAIQAIQQYENFTAREFGSDEKIGLGALVEVTADGERTLYFIGPSAGGVEITSGSETVLVITPQSPLGHQLIGKRQGDDLDRPARGPGERLRVVSVR